MMGLEVIPIIMVGLIMPLLLGAAGAAVGAFLGARQAPPEAVDLGAVLGAILGVTAGMPILSLFPHVIIGGPPRGHTGALIVPLGVWAGTAVGYALMRGREPRILGIGMCGMLGGWLFMLGGWLYVPLAAGSLEVPVLGWEPLLGGSVILADQIAYVVKRRRAAEVGAPAPPPLWIRAERVAFLAVALRLIGGLDDIAIIFAGLHMGSGVGALVGGLGRVLVGAFNRPPGWGLLILWVLTGAAGGALAGFRIRQAERVSPDLAVPAGAAGPVLAALTMTVVPSLYYGIYYGTTGALGYLPHLLQRALLALAGGYALHWAVTACVRLRTRK